VSQKNTSRNQSGQQTKLQQLLYGPDLFKPQYLTFFTRQLAIMLDAGLSMLASLHTLEEQCGNRRSMAKQRRVLTNISSTIEKGSMFSQALGNHPKSFNKLYVSMVRAGEVAGAMVIVLRQLADYMEKTARFKKKVVGSMIYPAILMTVAVSITLVLMIFVVPKFADIFADLLEGEPLPPLTAMIMGLSSFLVNNFIVCAGGVVALIMATVFFGKTKKGRYAYDYAMIKLPPLNGFVLKINVGRFCSTLSTLLENGVPALEAMKIVYDTSSNILVRDVVQTVYTSISEGEGISRPLEQTKLFPIMVVRLVEVGERTGALPSMLARISEQYEEEVENALETLVSLIEPVMIVFLAVVVGTIVIALFMPLIKIIETLGG